MSDRYAPPYRITPAILRCVERIGEALGNLRAHSDQTLMSDQESDYQSDQVMRLVRALRKSQRSAADLMSELRLAHRPTFRKNYLYPALAARLIEMTLPDTPRARNQKYRLTSRGKQFFDKREG